MPSTKRRALSSNKSNKKFQSKYNTRLSTKNRAVKVAEEDEEEEEESAVEESNPLRKEVNKDDDGDGDGDDDQVPANNTSVTTSVSTTTPTNSGLVILDRINEFNLTTWWLVDLHADPALRQGATLLVRRCMKAYGWTETRARAVLKAYRQFLFIKKEKKDWNAEILSPSSSVDQMWQQHILDVVNYAHDCMFLCGFVVGRNPDHGLYDDDDDDDDNGGRQRRRNATRQALLEHFENVVDQSENGEWKGIFLASEEVFENAPNEVTPASSSVEIAPNEVLAPASSSAAGVNGGDLTLQVCCENGMIHLVRLNWNTRLEHLYRRMAQEMGEETKSIRLLFDGDIILDCDTPQILYLVDNDQIDCVLARGGR